MRVKKHVDPSLKLVAQFFMLRRSMENGFALHLKLSNLASELSYGVFKLDLAVGRRLPAGCPRPAVSFDLCSERNDARLKLGHSDGRDGGRRKLLDYFQFMLPEPALVEYADQPDGARHPPQRIKRIRILALALAAALQAKQPVAGALWIIKVSDASPSYQRRRKHRKRYSRILSLQDRAARGN